MLNDKKNSHKIRKQYRKMLAKVKTFTLFQATENDDTIM